MEQQIQVPKTARYFTSQSPHAGVKEVWIVLHGYGQLAEFFLRKFQPIFRPDVLVVAPEGLHRYYREGYSGRVGASWMTKESRTSDIADYVGFLTAVYDEVKAQVGTATFRVIGFSQGAATGARWLAETEVDVAQYVVWAGSIPKDVDLVRGRNRLNATHMQVWMGDQDEFITEDHILSGKAWIEQAGLKHELHRYAGGHNILPDVLLEVAAQARKS